MGLRTVTPWLAQGDVFERVPQVVSALDSGIVKASVDVGAALLITHDCDLDKPRGKSSQPRIERLQFVPLLDLAGQDPNRQALARREELQPPEVVYVGEVVGVGEAFGLLGEAYALPAEFFELTLEVFPEHPEAEPGNPHLVANRHGNRLSRLDKDSLQLMQRKISAFYLRVDPDLS